MKLVTPTRRRTISLKKRAALGIAAAVAGVAASGCASSPAPQAQSAGAGAAHTVTVWSWNVAAKALQGLTPDFEKRNPDTHVTVDMTGARMQMRFMLSLASGVGAPDVSQLQMTDAPHYIATRRLADLTPYAAKYQKSFPPAQWQSCLLEGHVYAIPWDIGPCAVFYKRDLFARYGIDPAKIDTWDDYIRAGQEIVRKSGGKTRMLPLGDNDLEGLLEILMQQTGGQLFDRQGRVALDSPPVRDALDVVRRLRQSGIGSDVAAYGPEWMAGFNDDSIASYPGAVWLAGTIKDTATDSAAAKNGRWGVFRLPAVRPGGLHVANSGGSVLVIPDSCPDKAAAWRFIEYALCTREGQLSQYRSSSLYPAYLPALQSPIMDEPDPFFGGQRIGRFFSQGITQIQPLNRTPDWAEATTFVQQSLSHWASEGAPSDPAVLPTISRELSQKLGDPLAPPASPHDLSAVAHPVIGSLPANKFGAKHKKSAAPTEYPGAAIALGPTASSASLRSRLPGFSPEFIRGRTAAGNPFTSAGGAHL